MFGTIYNSPWSAKYLGTIHYKYLIFLISHFDCSKKVHPLQNNYSTPFILIAYLLKKKNKKNSNQRSNSSFLKSVKKWWKGRYIQYKRKQSYTIKKTKTSHTKSRLSYEKINISRTPNTKIEVRIDRCWKIPYKLRM